MTLLIAYKAITRELHVPYTGDMSRSYPAMTIVIGLSKALGLAVAFCGTLGGVLALIGAVQLRNALGLVSTGFAIALIPGSLRPDRTGTALASATLPSG